MHPHVKSPAMTGRWEAQLKRIQRGTDRLPPFLEGIENYVREVVGRLGERPPAPRSPLPDGRGCVPDAPQNRDHKGPGHGS